MLTLELCRYEESDAEEGVPAVDSEDEEVEEEEDDEDAEENGATEPGMRTSIPIPILQVA